ncbi:MAG: S26 family signal peptidase [Clostridia bacterium]|nr:S26 family signal peptidase [Clostridia bacterium]
MSGFECYVFFLCLVVFLMLAGMFGFFIAHTYKMTVRLTRLGEEDDTIKTEYQKKQETKQWVTVTERVISALLCVILLCIFVFSLVVGVQEELVLDAIPSLRVVQSGSMASKYPTNTYLFEHDLNDQFGTFDLILVYKPPSFDELQLYDVVVYEVDGMDIVHRIVGLEEHN